MVGGGGAGVAESAVMAGTATVRLFTALSAPLLKVGGGKGGELKLNLWNHHNYTYWIKICFRRIENRLSQVCGVIQMD